MPQVRKLSMLGALLAASGTILISAASAAKPSAAAKPHRFNVAGTTFEGSAKTICVIEGKWKDGEYFRFEAWDECSEMRMRRLPAAELQDVRSLGDRSDHTAADVPQGAEVIEMSNDYSTVVLFRDTAGIMREILSRD
jgi:hypothetical protein